MIQITPQMRILVAVEAVDFRKGIDGLAAICREWLSTDPFSGAVFVFRNRGGQALRIFTYDGQGFWMCHKRLSKGRFRHWPTGKDGDRINRLAVQELQLLIWNGNPAAGRTARYWREIPVSA